MALPQARNAATQRFMFSAALDNLGDGVILLYLPLTMLSLTDSPVYVAFAYVAKAFASLIATASYSALLDRYPITGAIRAAKSLRIIVILAMLIVEAHLGIFLLSALLLGATEAFLDNASQLFLLQTSTPIELPSLNSRFQSLEHALTYFVGPLVAGLLIDIDPRACPVFLLCVFMSSLIFIRSLSGSTTNVTADYIQRNPSLAEGARYLFEHRHLRALCLSAAGFCTIVACLFSIAPALIAEATQQAAYYSSVFYGVHALGFLIGSTVISNFSSKMPHEHQLLASLCINGVAAWMIALSATLTVFFAGTFMFGIAMGAWSCTAVNWRQQLIPKYLFSRANASYRLCSWLALCGGGLLAGGVYTSFGSAMLLQLMAGLATLLPLCFYRHGSK